MLTPQDIQKKEFVKAVFGGYDMTAVDDFLEEIADDYATLHKENAILKSKIKVLVEKVEEYRSTEDAMRMALLTAQKMGDNLVSEAKEKSATLLADAEAKAKSQLDEIEKQIQMEEARLQQAKEKTASFISASRQLIDAQDDFLARLELANAPVASDPSEARSSVSSASDSSSSSPAASRASFTSDTQIFNVPGSDEQEDMPTPEEEVKIEATADQIDSYMSNMFKDDSKKASKKDSSDSDNSDSQEISADAKPENPTANWDDDEQVTPRPKFDFNNLKFGSNYSNKDGED